MHQFYIAIGDVSVLGDQYLTSCLPKQISVLLVTTFSAKTEIMPEGVLMRVRERERER